MKSPLRNHSRLAPVIGSAILGLFTLDAGATSRPCDIYQAGGTPCIAAHSTVRALYGNFNGAIYQVRRASDNTMKDIGVLAPGGEADGAAQDAFCKGTSCVITKLYDQSGKGNFLEYQGAGSSVTGSAAPSPAGTESFNLSGHKVYSLYINPGNTYWRDGHLTGVPTGSAPEAMYMVTSGTHVNGGCCFDYGNSETTRKADAAGAMDAIYFGTSCWFASSHPCSGKGPWVQADLEWGLYPGGSQNWNTSQKSFTNKYVTAMLKNNGTTKFAMKGSDAQAGSLSTLWDGALPSGYNPMKKQGAIVLGSGGDCCRVGGGVNQSLGTFYEGAMVAGYPADSTDNSIQANIVAAGYGSATVSISDREFRIGPAPILHRDPTDGKTLIRFELEKAGHVRMRVVDRQGREIARLLDIDASAGAREATWDSKSARAGVYSLVMEFEGRTAWSGNVVAGR